MRTSATSCPGTSWQATQLRSAIRARPRSSQSVPFGRRSLWHVPQRASISSREAIGSGQSGIAWWAAPRQVVASPCPPWHAVQP